MAPTKQKATGPTKQRDRNQELLLLLKKEMHEPLQQISTPAHHRSTVTLDAPRKKRKYEPLRHLFNGSKVSKLVLTPVTKKKKSVRWASPIKQEQFEDSMFADVVQKNQQEEIAVEEVKKSYFDARESARPISEIKTAVVEIEPNVEFVTQAARLPRTELEIKEIVVDAMLRKLCSLFQGLVATERHQLLVGIKETHAAECKTMGESHPDEMRKKFCVDGTGVALPLSEYAELYSRIGSEIDMLEKAAYFASAKADIKETSPLYLMHDIVWHGKNQPLEWEGEDREIYAVAEIMRLVVKTQQHGITVRRTTWQQISDIRNKDMQLYAGICKLLLNWSKGVESIELAASLVRQLDDEGPGCLRDIIGAYLTKLQSTEFFSKYASRSTAWHEEYSDFNDLRLVFRQLLKIVRQVEGLVELDEDDGDSIDLADSEKEDEKWGVNL